MATQQDVIDYRKHTLQKKKFREEKRETKGEVGGEKTNKHE